MTAQFARVQVAQGSPHVRHTCVHTRVDRKPSAPSRIASATFTISGGPLGFDITQWDIHSAITMDMEVSTKMINILGRGRSCVGVEKTS